MSVQRDLQKSENAHFILGYTASVLRYLVCNAIPGGHFHVQISHVIGPLHQGRFLLFLHVLARRVNTNLEL